MKKIQKERAELARQILAAPNDHDINLELFDGETPIVAVPLHKTGKVMISISRLLKLNATLDPYLALRLAGSLSWAATEILLKKPTPLPAIAPEPAP